MIFPNILTKIVISRKKIKENVMVSKKIYQSCSERDCASTSLSRRTWTYASLFSICPPCPAFGERTFFKAISLLPFQEIIK